MYQPLSGLNTCILYYVYSLTKVVYQESGSLNFFYYCRSDQNRLERGVQQFSINHLSIIKNMKNIFQQIKNLQFDNLPSILEKVRRDIDSLNQDGLSQLQTSLLLLESSKASQTIKLYISNSKIDRKNENEEQAKTLRVKLSHLYEFLRDYQKLFYTFLVTIITAVLVMTATTLGKNHKETTIVYSNSGNFITSENFTAGIIQTSTVKTYEQAINNSSLIFWSIILVIILVIYCFTFGCYSCKGYVKNKVDSLKQDLGRVQQKLKI